ncbi:MAG TPA: TIGR03067 domain-containing protein [Puia sp.]|nr:TIGR03067 domain-containing protein [Puia sp.]
MNITGKWKINQARLGARQLSPADFEKLVLELDENSYQLIEGKVIDSGIVEMIAGHTPDALSITGVFGPYKGKTFQCIYRFEGEDMIMCYNLGGDGIPDNFEPSDNPMHYLVRYRRV